MFSDQLATVISGFYGHDIAEVWNFLKIFLCLFFLSKAYTLLCWQKTC
jgi:hypothetical protein